MTEAAREPIFAVEKVLESPIEFNSSIDATTIHNVQISSINCSLLDVAVSERPRQLATVKTAFDELCEAKNYESTRQCIELRVSNEKIKLENPPQPHVKAVILLSDLIHLQSAITLPPVVTSYASISDICLDESKQLCAYNVCPVDTDNPQLTTAAVLSSVTICQAQEMSVEVKLRKPCTKSTARVKKFKSTRCRAKRRKTVSETKERFLSETRPRTRSVESMPELNSSCPSKTTSSTLQPSAESASSGQCNGCIALYSQQIVRSGACC